MKTVDEFSPSAEGRVGSVASVLVVDDEAAVRRFACRVLERAGYRVFEAIDGVEALELIQGQTVALELVVSDIVMPRYATTALSERGIVAPCSILPKPFSAERLLAEVERCAPRLGGGSSAA